MTRTGDLPRAIVQQRGLEQISDAGELEAIVKRIVAANPFPPTSSGRAAIGCWASSSVR